MNRMASYPIHVFGAGIGRKHGEDPSAATHIQNDFILEHVLVVVHGVPVGERPHLVLQHLLFETRESVAMSKCCGATGSEIMSPNGIFTPVFRPKSVGRAS